MKVGKVPREFCYRCAAWAVKGKFCVPHRGRPEAECDWDIEAAWQWVETMRMEGTWSGKNPFPKPKGARQCGQTMTGLS